MFSVTLRLLTKITTETRPCALPYGSALAPA